MTLMDCWHAASVALLGRVVCDHRFDAEADAESDEEARQDVHLRVAGVGGHGDRRGEEAGEQGEVPDAPGGRCATGSRMHERTVPKA